MASMANRPATLARPGGRTAKTTARINQATLKILVEEGIEACTFARVAEVAGVQRSTLYRRYPDRWAMMIEAYTARAAVEVAVEPTGSFLDDLRLLLTRFADNFASPIGPILMTVVLAVRGTPAQAHVERFLDTRLRQIEPLFGAAIARGEIDPSIDRRAIVGHIAGRVIFRLFIENRPADERWINSLMSDAAALSYRSTVPAPCPETSS